MAGPEPSASASSSSASSPGTSPARAGLVLGTLILVAGVANLNLAVANVALPSIGQAFDASQIELNLVAVGYSLGLAASVIYFGALGDRHGRKLMILLGLLLAVPASLVAGLAPSPLVLFAARVVGGLSAGLAFPTTLALITALWSGPARTRAIALWSALGSGLATLGPLLSGIMLEIFDWGSVFLMTIPLALLALYLAWRFLPRGVGETTSPVDNAGGVLSVVMIGTFVVALNLVAVPDMLGLTTGLFVVSVLVLVLFVIRQRRAASPLYDLRIAARPTFWVAATAGVIIFGAMMGIVFINQQYLQNVLGYDTVAAGAAILPAVVLMILVAPRSARLVHEIGSRATLLVGQSLLALSFVGMFFLWGDDTSYVVIAIPLLFMGVGIGLAQTPSANSLTASVPVSRAGMASGTADLQRDLGGALMTSLFGALLTAGYASRMGAAISESGKDVTSATQSQLQLSYASATHLAAEHPNYASQIIEAARASFLAGDRFAYVAGFVAVLVGASVVYLFYPRKEDEERVRASYATDDDGPRAEVSDR